VDRLSDGRVTGTAVAAAAPGGGAAALVGVPLPEGRVLAAVTPLALRALRLNSAARQGVLVADRAGAVLAQQGTAPAEPAVSRLVKGAVTAADNRPASRIGRVATVTDPQSGRPARLKPVVVAARVGDLDLAVVSVTFAAYVDGGARWRGVEPAAGLILIAIALLGVLYLGLIRPIGRTLNQAKAVACGERPPRPRTGGLAEARRLAAALDAIAAGIRRAPQRRVGRHGVRAALIVFFAALSVVGWSAAVTGRYGGGATAVPAQVSIDARNDVDGVAIALRDKLLGGLAGLRTVVGAAAGAGGAGGTGAAGTGAAGTGAPGNGAAETAAAGTEADRFRGPLNDLIAADDGLRSAYLADRSGAPLVRAGAEPRRARGAPPGGDGVRLDRVSGPVPIVYAHLRVSDQHTLIAEFDVRELADVLRRANGRLRAVDPELRTILDTGGYVAFRAPSAGSVRKAATDAFADRAGTTVAPVDGTRVLLATVTVGGDEALPALRWAIVAERPMAAFRLPDNDLSRGTWLVAFLALCAAVLLFTWYHLVVIRPYRQMVGAAERLAKGDGETTICPVRHDEVGAIAVCLDISRQALVDGPERLAGAARLRGLGTETMVMPVVVTERPEGPGTRRAGSGSRAASSAPRRWR
jgi:HAMP domain-containing protein